MVTGRVRPQECGLETLSGRWSIEAQKVLRHLNELGRAAGTVVKTLATLQGSFSRARKLRYTAGLNPFSAEATTQPELHDCEKEKRLVRLGGGAVRRGIVTPEAGPNLATRCRSRSWAAR